MTISGFLQFANTIAKGLELVRMDILLEVLMNSPGSGEPGEARAERFAELVLAFPDDANPSYFEAVLRGISDANLDLEAVVRVCERCHRIEAGH